MIVPVSRRWAD